MKGTGRIFTLLFLVVISLHLNAQKASVKSDKYRLLIGQQAVLTLNAKPAEGERVIWPSFPDSLGPHFDIVARGKIDTLTDSTRTGTLFQQQLSITSFDSGMYTLPVFDFNFINSKGDTESVVTDPLSIEVHTVAVDTTQAIRDIRDVIDVPFDIREYIPWILGGLALAALVFAGIYFWLRRRRPLRPVTPIVPAIPAWEKAMNALDKIGKEQVWKSGYEKAYHSAITDTIRIFIEEQFQLPALESTTDEIMQMIRKMNFSESALLALKQILILADLVKFAKEKPLPAEHERSLEQAKQFVLLTRPVAELKHEKGKVVENG